MGTPSDGRAGPPPETVDALRSTLAAQPDADPDALRAPAPLDDTLVAPRAGAPSLPTAAPPRSAPRDPTPLDETRGSAPSPRHASRHATPLDETRESTGDAAPPPPPRPPVAAPSDLETRLRPRVLDDTVDALDPAGSADAPARLRIGRYAILRKLGEGGMGEVYTAYDEELDRRVAIKVLHQRRAGDRLGAARMQREAQAMARLSHPNVVQVHDVGSDDAQLFITMEYVEGKTLRLWQREVDPRTRAGVRAILDVYAQAGEGLAAAHREGLVHRDFKPDNVLVGADGRARVLDFGLAAARAGETNALDAIAESATTGRLGVLDSDLTATGSVMGTPAYMAPEQFLAEASDARTDQFSFCVALYEALYDELPFAGDTFYARQIEVTEGQPLPPPRGRPVPEGVRAALMQGLARRPEDRFPTMAPLLRILRHDPARARRRRLAVLRAAAMIVAGLGLVIYVGVSLSASWERRAREAAAAERLARAEARIEGALEAGDREAAGRAFAGFVDAPENRGTASLSQAWLGEAARRGAAEDLTGKIDALAQAYTGALRTEERASALYGLADHFRDRLHWDSLAWALASLDALETDAHARERDRLAIDSQLARRDFAGALARIDAATPEGRRLRPVLQALAEATPTAYRDLGRLSAVDLEGDGVRELRVRLTRGGLSRESHRYFALTRADPQLTEITTLDLKSPTFLPLEPGPGQPALFVTTDPPGRERRVARARVHVWEDGELREVFAWDEQTLLSSLSADLDGDGAPELLLGGGPYLRRLLALERGLGGGLQITQPAPAIDRRASDVAGLLAVDLDGDGRLELIVGHGPWTAYEVTALRWDEDHRELTPIARRRLGNIEDIAVLAGPRPRIAVLKSPRFANAKVFPDDKPNGEPDGVYVLDGPDLEIVDHIPAPPALTLRELFTGDLDGDGHGELFVTAYVSRVDGPDWVTQVIVGAGSPQGHDTFYLRALQASGAVDLDDDGDDELVAVLNEGEETRTWVLGTGEQGLPPAAPPRLGAAVEAGVDPRLRAADELVQMGLLEQAAATYESLGDELTGDARLAALERAAELFERLHDATRAATLYQRVFDGDPRRTIAGEGAARNLLRRGEFERGRQVLGALLDAPALAEGERQRLAPLLASLDALTRGPAIELDFSAPLGPGWVFEQPSALRHDPVTRALEIHVLEGGSLATLALAGGGSPLLLEVTLDVHRVEWGAGVDIVVRGAPGDDGRSPVVGGTAIGTGGGGTSQALSVACAVGSDVAHGQLRRDGIGSTEGRFIVTLLIDPLRHEWMCGLRDADGSEIRYGWDRLIAPLPDVFELALHNPHGAGGSAAVGVSRIGIRGVHAREAAADIDEPWQVIARAHVEGRYAEVTAAIAEDEADPRRAALRRVALAHSGAWVDAADSLRAALADPERRDQAREHWARELKRTPTLAVPVMIAAAGRAATQSLLADVWADGPRRDDDTVALSVLLDGLRDLDPAEHGRSEYVRLLAVRAAEERRAGQPFAARRTLLALLDALDGDGEPVDNADELRADAHFGLAQVAAQVGEPEVARAQLDAAMGATHVPERILDRVAAEPRLAKIGG